MCFNFPDGWAQAATAAQAKYEYEQKKQYEAYQKIINVGLTPLYNIRLCRRPVVGITQWNGSLPGHYWIEIIHTDEDESGKSINGQACFPNGYRESYGWYPTKALMAAEGCLNGDWPSRKESDKEQELNYKSERNAGRSKMNNDISSRAFDPHQSDHHTTGLITYETIPYLLPGDKRSEGDIIDEIRSFAANYKNTYSKTWDYKFDHYSENNCHTFLILLLFQLNLADLHIGKNKDKHFNAYYRSTLANIVQSKFAFKFYKRLRHVKNNCEKLKQLLKK